MANIEMMIHENGEKFFPYAHTKGVVDNNGLTVDDHLKNIYRDNSDIRSIVEGLMSLEALPESVYGIEFDTTVASPTCTRIGNMTLHRTLPIQSRMRGCLLNDDGLVVEYLPQDDWRDSVRDGSKGQVMVEIPKHWRKCETDGTKRRVLLSPVAVDGYHEVPKMYVGAYEASLQRSTLKLCSVINHGEDYRGGDNNSSYPLLSYPVTNLSRTQFRNYARNRNQSTTEWNCYTYDCHKAIYWLFTVEYATLNCQLAYNAQLTSEGFHQGGLGAGLTDVSSEDWSIANGYRPLIRCGEIDNVGNRSEATWRLLTPLGQQYYQANRYRGIEHPFGHLWKWVDGINIAINPNTDSYPYSEVLICSEPSLFSDKWEGYYEYVGFEARKSGYGITHLFGAGGEIIPSAVGGSSTTYLCDYHYTDIPSSATIRGVLFGGSADNGSDAGFACARSNYVPSGADTNIGSRLCFIPR